MFIARLEQGHLLKKIMESIKDFVSNVNIDISPSGISMQAIDQSHVALVSLNLKEVGFGPGNYRADRPMTIGLSITNLNKVLKCAGTEDIITMKADADPSHLSFIFESPYGDKISTFNLNLISLDSEQLGIPETSYSSVCAMSSIEFSRICRELGQIAESVNIETTKEYIKFSVSGEIGGGEIILRQGEMQKSYDRVILEVAEPVSASFALRYLNSFNKASVLSTQVILSMSPDTPLVVEFKVEKLGSMKFYLAPKLNEESET